MLQDTVTLIRERALQLHGRDYPVALPSRNELISRRRERRRARATAEVEDIPVGSVVHEPTRARRFLIAVRRIIGRGVSAVLD